MPSNQLHRNITWACVLACLVCLPFKASAIIDPALQMQLGNPSGATTDTNNHSHYLIVRDVEALDYNDLLGQANWASWDLTAADVGSAGRSPDFFTDTTLPTNFLPPVPGDPINPFSGSGYDRGHLCPSADRTDTRAHNDEVFLMSNIIPQASLQNQNIWSDFEDYSRAMLSTNEVLIICGPSLFTTNKLYTNRVTIPGFTWKIAVCVPLGPGMATNRITPSTRVIAINIPNTEAVASDPWQNYITSVNKIQDDTGFTFFTALSSNLATVLRSKVDGQPIPPPNISGFSPVSGFVGQNVSITGTNLNFTTNVAFNGLSAAFSIVSATNLNVTVPNGAVTGPITVKTLGGTTNSAGNFTVNITTNADLAISSSHSGTFTQGDIGRTLSIIVSNIGAAAVAGQVSVSNALPVGLLATAIGGSGWTADLNTLTCTRLDSAGPDVSYPPITITVDVLSNAPAVVTNVAVVSNVSETNLANSTASDVIATVAASAPVVFTGSATNINGNLATVGGTVSAGGQPASAQFEYGLTTNYGSVTAVPGTFTGTNTQLVSAVLTNLSPGTEYHYRATGSNVLGLGVGLDQTFTTAALVTPDLVVSLSHIGNFTRGDVGDNYMITVTNIGGTAPSGPIVVTNLLPSGLTATAIGGPGWTADLGALSCTRSEALAPGAGFPPITVTVNVAPNAPGSITNRATAYTAGDANPVNDIVADPTVINPVVGAAVLAAWDTSSLPGGVGNYGPSPFGPTTNSSNVIVVGLTRGPGVGTSNSGAGRGWGGNGWTNLSSALAIASNQFVTFAISPKVGYQVSFSTISRFDYRRSSTGPAVGLLQYQLGSGPFTDITTLSYPTNTIFGGSMDPISLSNISALQNVGPGTNVTFRVVNWGGGVNGTWYVFDVASNSAPDLVIQGLVAPVLTPIQSWRFQYFGSTNNSGPSANGAVASSDGMPNLLKYGLGLNPLVPATNPVVGDIDTGYLRLTTPKNPSATDISYIVQVTGGVSGPWTSDGTVVDQNTPTLLQVHDGVPVSTAPQRFIRLEITNP